MKQEHLIFLGELIKRITSAYSTFKNNDCDITTEHHESKDYWTINCLFKWGNAEYTDCVVFYLREDDFEPGTILEDFDKIFKKAKFMSGKG